MVTCGSVVEFSVAAFWRQREECARDFGHPPPCLSENDVSWIAAVPPIPRVASEHERVGT